MINRESYKVWDKKSTKEISKLMNNIESTYNDRLKFYDRPEDIGGATDFLAGLNNTKDEQTEKAWHSNGIALYKDALRLLKKFNITHPMYEGVEIWELKMAISDEKRELKNVPQARAIREKQRKEFWRYSN